MNCPSCNNKGYIESSIIRDNSNFPMAIKCPNPNCPFKANYYQYIKNRYSNSEVPKESVNTYDIVNPHTKEHVDIYIPQSILDQGSVVISNYVMDYIRKLPNSPIQSESPIEPTRTPLEPTSKEFEPTRTPLEPTRTPESRGPSQVPANDTDQKVEMDTTYPNLPKAVVTQYNDLTGKHGEGLPLMLDTPFGPKEMKNLEDANKTIGIINKYFKFADELSYADEFENVIVFPLGKALGF